MKKNVLQTQITLQKRELQLLHFIAKFGLISQNHACVLLNLTTQTIKNVYKRLIAAAYIEKEQIIAGNYYLRLGKSAAKLLATTVLKKLPLNTIQHDMLVIDLYLELVLKHGIASEQIESERQLKSASGFKLGQKKKLPDLLINNSIAIEVELSEKSNNRLIEIVGLYINNINITEVRYFVKSKALAAKIAQIAGNHPKIRFFLLDSSSAVNLSSPLPTSQVTSLLYTEINNTTDRKLTTKSSATSFDLDAYLKHDWSEYK